MRTTRYAPTTFYVRNAFIAPDAFDALNVFDVCNAFNVRDGFDVRNAFYALNRLGQAPCPWSVQPSRVGWTHRLLHRLGYVLGVLFVSAYVGTECACPFLL